MLVNLRRGLDAEKRREENREKGKIPKLRRRATEVAELSFVNSSLTVEEQDIMIRNTLEAIRILEVRRANELTEQIDEWDDDDFHDATILLIEGSEDRELLNAKDGRNKEKRDVPRAGNASTYTKKSAQLLKVPHYVKTETICSCTRRYQN